MTKDNSYGFDGTIQDYPYRYTNKISFIKKNIHNINDDNNTDLSFLTDKYDKIFLKIDIEGGEYDIFRDIDKNILSKIKKIAIEVHDSNRNKELINNINKNRFFYFNWFLGSTVQTTYYFS
jgi:hypothetical protein